MKAQVLYEYDPSMQRPVWVEEAEMPAPQVETASDVVVKIGAAGVCAARTSTLLRASGAISRIQTTRSSPV